MEEQSKRPYFRASTASQRQKMFEVWEETSRVNKACEAARLSRGTFYYWQARFEQEGYKGVEVARSHAPHHPRRTPEAIAEQVVKLKEEHPGWGYQRLADELRKNNNWQQVVSASTIRYILKAAGVTPGNGNQQKKKKT